MTLKNLKLIGLMLAIAVFAGRCELLGLAQEEEDPLSNPAVLAAIAVATQSDDSSATATATFNITNNTGATRTYTAHPANNSCADTAVASTGTVANGATGTMTVPVSSSGYDILDGNGACSAAATGTQAKTYTCEDSGAVACT